MAVTTKEGVRKLHRTPTTLNEDYTVVSIGQETLEKYCIVLLGMGNLIMKFTTTAKRFQRSQVIFSMSRSYQIMLTVLETAVAANRTKLRCRRLHFPATGTNSHDLEPN
jgi:hypothetical protein